MSNETGTKLIVEASPQEESGGKPKQDIYRMIKKYEN